MARSLLSSPLLLGLFLLPSPLPAQPPATPTRPRLDWHGDPLPAGVLQRLGKVERLRQGGSVLALALSPDGTVLASAGSQGTICLWAFPSGTELRTLTGHEGPVYALAFAPDGKTLVSGGADRSIHFWDPSTGRQTWRCRTNGALRALAFSPDGTLLAGAGEFHVRCLRLWDVRNGIEAQQSIIIDRKLDVVAFAPDGKLLASGGADGQVDFWDTASGRRLHTANPGQGGVTSLRFTGDGKSVLCGGGNGSLVALDAATARAERLLDEAGRTAYAAAVSADGKSFAVAGSDRTLVLWDLAGPKRLRSYPLGGDLIGAVALSADGSALAAGTLAGRIRLWRQGSNAEQTKDSGQAPVHGIALAPDGKAAATVEQEAVRVWDATSGKALGVLRAGGEQFGAAAWSPDGRLLAVCSTALADKPERMVVRLWEVAGGKTAHTFSVPGARPLAVAFAVEGNRVYCACRDGTVHVWNPTTGATAPHLTLEGARPEVAVFSPDGRLLAGAASGWVQVWETASGRKVAELGAPPAQFIAPALGGGEFGGRGFVGGFGKGGDGPHGQVGALALSPDGRVLAVLGQQGLKLWELATGDERARLAGPRNPSNPPGPCALAFSPDGRLLAVADQDVTATLWDVSSGTEAGRLVGHRDVLSALAFRADGRALASGSGDTTALLWDVSKAGARARAVRPLSPRGAEAAWDNLGGPDAAAAQRHLWALVRAPEQSLPLLRQRLRPVPPFARRIEVLIADLDSARYSVRQRATVELSRMGALARPALEKALAAGPALEARRRIEGLLAQTAATRTDPQQSRAVRGVEVLEHVGTPEARRLLEDLARGEPQALLTLEARAALRRLGRRAALGWPPPGG
jgi:WD40 repeat protein